MASNTRGFGTPPPGYEYNEIDQLVPIKGGPVDDVEGATTGDPESEDFNIKRFEQLLERLEGSKKRQQRQRSVEGRRDIFAQGLAGMMSNF